MLRETLEESQRWLVASIGSSVSHRHGDAETWLQEEPLIRFVNRMIHEAVEQGVSDVHVEPFETICRIRYRQHGVLRTMVELPVVVADRMVARLKVMAELDMAERRLPQDGRFQLTGVDIRISTCPVIHGEKCVLRLLGGGNGLLGMEHMGMSPEQREIFCRALSQPQGMVLVTGPTGSGKTVTLYAGLNFLNHVEKNIATVEDPVEIRFPGINQVNVNFKVGLQFATVLRALLRQDPDVIMVGEIRDQETAEVAVQAAQTGHLVLATLHTNSAEEAFSRLQGMGIARGMIDASVRLVIAQRLLRVLCVHCRRKVCPDRAFFPEIVSAGNRVVYEAVGCAACVGGYTGRTAIFEFWPQDKVHSLRAAGVEKVFSGQTSPHELARMLVT